MCVCVRVCGVWCVCGWVWVVCVCACVWCVGVCVCVGGVCVRTHTYVYLVKFLYNTHIGA